MSIVVYIAPDVPLPTAVEQRWLSQMPPQRRAQMRGWAVADRHRSLVAAQLLRRGLAGTGMAAPLQKLRYDARGKPGFDAGVRVSISHCPGRVVCALSRAADIGIDVETIQAATAFEFPSYFDLRECDWAGASSRRFHALWTRKEAIAKAAGNKGLAAMRDIRLDPHRGTARYAGERWWTVALPVGPRHIAHLAARGQRPRVSVHRLSARALEDGSVGGQSDFLQER